MAELLSELVVRCRTGEASAVAELVRRFQPWAVDFATALLDGDVHLAEDTVQSAFVVALSGLDRLRDTDAFAGWLRQIVRTEARRITRRRGEIQQPMDDRMVESADAAELAERVRIVRDAVASLPPRTGEAAMLHYLQELEIREVAARLSIPVGTVKRRLHDARQKLRERLRNQLPL